MSSDKKPKPCPPPVDRRKLLEDPQMNTDFTFNLDECLVQASRCDREAMPTPPGVVERVWVTCRPPRLGHGVEPTVSARRAYVMLTHIQGQMIDTGELVCKKVCKPANEAVNISASKNPNKQNAGCASRGGICKGIE